MRDIIATIFVPILTVFSIPLNRTDPFDIESVIFVTLFLSGFVLSFIGFVITDAYQSRLKDYGENFSGPISKMMDNYCRETLIYVAVMVGVSAGPAIHRL